jgi:hypothetical protein
MTRTTHAVTPARLLLAAALLFGWLRGPAEGLDFPGPAPGEARARIEGDALTLENDVLAVSWTTSGGHLQPSGAIDRLSGNRLLFSRSEAFEIVLAQAPLPSVRTLRASELRLAGKPEVRDLPPQKHLPRLAEQCAGKEIVVNLVSPDGNLEVQWQVVLRDGSNYVRQIVLLKANREPAEVREMVLLSLPARGAAVLGSVDGSPVVAENWFFACEHPMSKSQVLEPGGAADPADKAKPAPPADAKGVRCSLPNSAPVQPGSPVLSSAVIGVVPQGQLRRGFLYYLERERAHPYRPFLHYNNGSEIGCEYWQRQLHRPAGEGEAFRLKQEQIWLEIIRAFGRELVEKRQVTMDGFAHDFEWDDENLVWQFHNGYPEGFTPAQQAAEKCGARLGVWFSPSGGYPCKPGRLKSGALQGFEMNANGLSLAGPRYYARFRDACVNMVRRYGVRYFKFDGFGAGNSLPGAGPYAGDVEALLRLIEELRQLDPEVFVNPSTGSWPSPFWLRYADSIWRQGADTSTAGKGSERQKWITYRDSEIRHGTLERGPLYPASSLMIHGIYINALPLFGNPYDPASKRPTYELADLTAEIRSFFGTGTNLQELYVNPSLMTAEAWDVLAEAAQWSRANADVLADTHWIGGDPAKGEAYGWASWSKRKGILMLRNPDDQPAKLPLDLGKAFELPSGAARKFTLRSPWKSDAVRPAITLSAGQPHTFELKPFEVLVFDAVPAHTAPAKP